jgi:hypothetical protein
VLTLDFEGYLQMRMATDPDPPDDKRGVSGYTFALAGEPDLDGKLHLQPDEPGAFQRLYGDGGGPQIGVTVRRATRDGVAEPELSGARVAFVDARLLENNGVLVREDFFVIDPLRVQVTVGDETVLDRGDWLNPADPSMPLLEATGAMVQRRQPNRFTGNSPEVAAATGLRDASNEAMIENRELRRKSLEALLARTPEDDLTTRAALTTRIEELHILHRWWMLTQGTPGSRPIDRRARQLTLQLDGWDVGVNGTVYRNTLGGDPTRPWRLRFWCGGFDGDALTCYLRGSWEIAIA